MPKHPHALVHPFRLTVVAFIEDLKSREKKGLEQPQCNAVVACLDSILGLLRDAPEGSRWLPELVVPFGKLRADYFSWNNPKGGDNPPSHRAAMCKEIRHHKDGMLIRFKFGPLLATEQERRIFENIYDCFNALERIVSTRENDKTPVPIFKKTVARAKEKQDDIRKGEQDDIRKVG